MQHSDQARANQWQNTRVAIVYDQATTRYGGAELVITELRHMFPQADLFTTVVDRGQAPWTDEWNVQTSFVQSFYRFIRRHEPLTPLMPLAIESLSSKLADYPLVISVSAGVAKGVITKPGQLHVCYLLTPTRYIHNPSPDYLQTYGAWKVARFIRLDKPLFSYVARWDRVAGRRPDKVIAISKLVAHRIEHAYGRNTDKIVYPPIPHPLRLASRKFLPPEIKPFVLCLSRLVWYKRIDAVIDAVLKDSSLPTLVVAGTGSEKKSLMQQAGERGFTRTGESVSDTLITAQKQCKRVIFLGNCDAEEKAALFGHAALFIMPGVEDFGLTAVEAASYGVASIIHKESGVAEILDTSLAHHLKEISAEGVGAGISQLLERAISPTTLKSKAMELYPDEFAKNLSLALDIFMHEALQKMKISQKHNL